MIPKREHINSITTIFISNDITNINQSHKINKTILRLQSCASPFAQRNKHAPTLPPFLPPHREQKTILDSNIAKPVEDYC